MKLALLLAPGLLLAQADWMVPADSRDAGYVKVRADRGFKLSGPGPDGAMTRTFDAIPYRGLAVRLRAAVRVEGEGAAQLILRVDREGGRLGFFDNMGDRPIRPGDWANYELTGEVAPDALTIEIGVLSSGKTDVSIDGVVFEKLARPAADEAAAREAIAGAYARVDAAYGEGDVDAVASLTTPDAQVILPESRLPLSTALAQIMEQVRRGEKFRSRSEVTAFRLAGAQATVWVNNETTRSGAGVLSSNRDVWVRTAAGWRLKQSALIAMRAVTPPEVLAEIRQRAGMPEWTNVRILLWQGAGPPAIPAFTAVPAMADRAAAVEAAVGYLKQHAPEEAGPATLAFQGSDGARMAAVVRGFDTRRADSADWSFARQAAVVAYQLSTGRREDALAAHVIWLASEAYRSGKILVATRDAAAIAPMVRSRYGKQVYVVGELARELVGGEHFIDIASVPAGSALGKWLAVQKLPFDGIQGR
jgi:hypothetical protein